ncbi:MAG: hypothetical protein ACOYXT_29985 [Bacteroidota bacterium]
MIEDFITKTEKKIDSLFDRLKGDIASQFSKQQLTIVISKNNFIPNTLLLRSIEFEVNNVESDDNGVCLSISIQRYDPAEEQLKVSEDSIFLIADLTRSTGEIIADTGIHEVSTSDNEELERVMNEAILFVELQKDVIVEKIRSEYLSQL